MLYQIVSLLLEVAAGLLAGVCLLRLYMQYQRVPFSNPVGRFVFALTDWLVLPLRRVVPSLGRWDMASLVGAYLVKLAQFGLLWLLAGGAVIADAVMQSLGLGAWVAALLMVVFGLTRVTQRDPDAGRGELRQHRPGGQGRRYAADHRGDEGDEPHYRRQGRDDQGHSGRERAAGRIRPAAGRDCLRPPHP